MPSIRTREPAIKHTDRSDYLFYLSAFLVIVFLYIFVYADMPVYGDAWGYGYHSASWMAENDLQPIPAGTERGERAGGHTAFFFWLWAVCIRIFGNTVQTAHLLPAIFSFLAVAGTYRLGRELGGRAVGIASGIALLLSPLFLAQAFRALPIAAVMSATAWSLLFFIRGRYLQASLLCVFAVMMREQSILLALSYIAAELIREKFKHPRRILLFALPFLVPVINGLTNLAVNGFFVQSSNALGFERSFNWHVLITRVRHFGGHMFASDFRWLPIGIGTGILASRKFGKSAGIILGLVLCVTGFEQRLLSYYILILTSSLFVLLLLNIRSVSRPAIAIGLFPFVMVLFFSILLFITSTIMQYNFFRYIMAAYPAVIVGIFWLLSLSRHRLLYFSVAALFIILTAVSNLSVKYRPDHSDSTFAGYYMPLAVIRDAGCWAVEQNNPILSVGGGAVNHYANPSLGYASIPMEIISLLNGNPQLEKRDYSIIIPPLLPWGDKVSENFHLIDPLLEEGYELERDTVFTRGPCTASCFLLHWD
jgi:4-amino-4-deoxy-L-arabinose transferase-like glycosyltransferase